MINFTKSKLNRFSYAGWKRYFAQNDAHRLVISFQNYTLTEKEKKLIFPSICQFQQGERSDGKHLKKAADIFAEKIHNEDYKHCIRLFIKEENVHSGYLKSYMDHYHVDVKKNVLLDMIFRQLRKLAGIRCEVIVLVTAEIIAFEVRLAGVLPSFGVKGETEKRVGHRPVAEYLARNILAPA